MYAVFCVIALHCDFADVVVVNRYTHKQMLMFFQYNCSPSVVPSQGHTVWQPCSPRLKMQLNLATHIHAYAHTHTYMHICLCMDLRGSDFQLSKHRCSFEITVHSAGYTNRSACKQAYTHKHAYVHIFIKNIAGNDSNGLRGTVTQFVVVLFFCRSQFLPLSENKFIRFNAASTSVFF